MFGRIGNAGIAIGVVVIVIGAIILWFWLGDNDLGDSPVDDAAQMEQLEESEGNEALGEESDPGEEGEF